MFGIILVAVFDGTGATDADRIKIYVDGVPEVLSIIFGAVPTVLTGTATSFRIGGWEKNTAFFDGTIDEVQIFSRALTHAEILAEFNAGGAGKCKVKTVSIDIKPGSDPNCFNNDGHGVIPVAILGSADFDVNEIDPSTVQLEGLDVRAVGKSNKFLARIEDSNLDGFDDLVVQIEDQDGTFSLGDATATVTGSLLDGTPIEGTDSICITQ